MTKARILVVDDDPLIRKLVQVTLASDDYQISEAADGQSALELCARVKPHVMIVDLQMPKMNGLELIEAVQETPNLAGTRAIVLTGRGDVELRRAGMSAGAVAYLTKPFSPIELLKAVARELDLSEI